MLLSLTHITFSIYVDPKITVHYIIYSFFGFI
jgi:hypothetical protein